MILIRDVIFKSVDGDAVEVFSDCEVPLTDGPMHSVEIVHGKRFVTADRREVVIGMTRNVQKVLGLPFEVIDNQNNALEMLTRTLNETTRKLNDVRGHFESAVASDRASSGLLKAIRGMTLLQRIRVLLGADPVRVVMGH